MGVKITDRQYKNQFYPATETTDWLIGNVGDWQRLELTFESQVIFNATQSETVQIDNLNNTFTLNNGKKWSDYGFDIGDSITLSWTIMSDPANNGTWTSVNATQNYTIQNLYDSVMETVQNFDFGIWEVMPTDRGNIKIKDVKFVADKEPEGLKFTYGHLTNENFNSGNLNSFIDGTETLFSFAGLQNLAPGQIADMNPDGFQSGMSIDKCRIQKLGNGNAVNYIERYNLGTPTTFRLYTYKSTLPLSGFTSQRDIDACSIAINRTLSASGYQNQICDRLPIYTGTLGTLTYLDGIQNRCFIYNNASSGNKYLNIDFKFKITNTNENSSTDRVCLVLIKYKNGTSLDFKERIELESWSNASALEGQVLSYSDAHTENLLAGESLCLALEWQHIAQPSQRFIDVQFVNMNVDVLNAQGTPQNGKYYYKVICDFMLSSIFEDVNNLIDKVAPDQVFDANSLTDNFLIEVFPEWNNPNTSIKNVLSHTERLGNTGWFDENFNGLDNDFVIESVKYYDLSGNLLQKLDYASPVLVEAVVSGIQNLSNNSEFGMGFAWIPINESDYKNKLTPYHENLLINTARKYTDGSFNLNENTGTTIYLGNTNASARMNISAFESIMFVQEGVDKAKMRAVFTPNADFNLAFENKDEIDRNYILWMSVANYNLQINFSNRVSLLLDYNTMEKSIPPAGPLPGMTNKFLEHPQVETANGVDNYYGHIEDDILSRVNFRINKNTTNIQAINFGYQVYNSQTELNYVLERINNVVSTFPQDSNNIQQIALNNTRGFKLVSGNNKNWVKINRNPVLDENDNVGYECYFATKIRWEDWIARTGVPTAFFDTSKLNNGYHNNWLDYLRKDVYNQMQFFVEVLAIEDGVLKAYKNVFQLAFDGYDENDNIDTEFRYYRNSDNSLINVGTDPDTGVPLGVILQNEQTRIEIDYIKLNGNFDFSKVYCTTCIEIEKGAGEMEFRQLSSVWLSESDNPLIPLIGEDNLKIELVAPNRIKASCLVEPSLLQEALRYKVTGRIGCWAEGTNQPPLGLYEERYQNTYE